MVVFYCILIGINLLFLLSFFSADVCGSFNEHEYVVTITDKERVNSRYNSAYLVFCEDDSGETLVLKNGDCLLRGKFNSSNVQGEIEEGRKYKFTVVGWRIPFLSWYENIIRYEEIK